MEEFVAHYGYLALFVGTVLEGEVIAVLAGFMAHRGYLSLPWVMVWAAIGSFVGDQIFFQFGRSQGTRLLARRPSWEKRAERIRGWLQRHEALPLIGFRFIYGIRSVTPALVGASGFPRSRFMLYDGIGAVLWAVVVSLLGYFFGDVMSRIIGDIEKYELIVIVGLVIVGSITFGILRMRRIRAMRKELEGDPPSTPGADDSSSGAA